MATALRSSRVRLAAASWLLVAVAAAVVVAGAERATGPLTIGAVVALVVLAGGLVTGRSTGLYVAIALVATGEVAGHPSDPPAVEVALLGATLLLAAELGSWSFERRVEMATEPGVDRRRWLAIAALVTAGLAASVLLQLLAAGSAVSGSALQAIAASAVVAAVASVRALALRHTDPTDP